ncbi:MAG: hypothetical protein WA459_01635 [Stellaceae bacterium]
MKKYKNEEIQELFMGTWISVAIIGADLLRIGDIPKEEVLNELNRAREMLLDRLNRAGAVPAVRGGRLNAIEAIEILLSRLADGDPPAAQPGGSGGPQLRGEYEC